MPEPATAPSSGLFTTNAVPVPLAGVSIATTITALCARVAVTQRYVNREATPIEATYVFPLDEGAAVCGFEAVIDGTLVVGEVKERDEAFRMYDDAMERGDGAFLLDEERPDVFQASIGNLPPGKEVLITLTYVTELACSETGLRFTIPTTVSPRYAPAEDRAGVGRPDAEALNPPHALHVPYGLQLSVNLAMSGRVSRIESPSHPVSVSLNGAEATVTLSSRETALDRDFVLAVDVEGLDAPVAWFERDADGAGAIAVAFVPRLDSGSTPSDITFVVDRSGSMAGTSIEEVRNALQLCLRSMIPGCRFNIVGFGSTYQALFSQSRAYDEASLTEASRYVAALDANLGGTEILQALEFVLGQQGERTLPRQVVVLTDGEVTNTDAVLALVKSHAAHARIFTFGIGAGASQHLVNGVARAGGGTAEFIFPGERIEPKVMRQFSRLLSPALTNVRIDWDGHDVTPATASLPPVFAGGRLLAYALANDLPDYIRLTADSPAGPLSLDARIDPSRSARGRTVLTLAARARIRELEESPDWLSLRGSRQSERKTSRVQQEIIALAIKYGLMSRATSYVAIERRETPVLGDVQLRRVPIALTTGWGGVDKAVLTLGARRMDAAARSMDTGVFLSANFDMDSAGDLSSESDPAAYSAPLESAPVARSSSSLFGLGKWFRRGKPEAAPAPMHTLVALQHADGSWDLTPEFANVIGRNLGDLAAAITGVAGKADEIRRAWATSLAVLWLQTEAAQAQSEWALLVAKATRWLDGVQAHAPGRSWLDAAARFLRRAPV